MSSSASSAQTQRRALVLYPSTEAYTTQALLKAFNSVLPDWTVHTARTPTSSSSGSSSSNDNQYDLQYADYDEIDWDAAECSTTLTNSYMLRKALIRKNYLATAVAHHLAKKPESILSQNIPKTYAFEIAHADELDELFYDELYEVSEALDAQSELQEGDEAKWWILKPAMTDKGQGIRLFNSKEALQSIFDSFEDDESDDDDEDDDGNDNSDSESPTGSSTRVNLSHMRDWVIQEYLNAPLLFDTSELHGRPSKGKGRKFHLRVYVLAVGDLEVYVYTDMLALFAGADFARPKVSHTQKEDGASDDAAMQDLAAHLTNTCLQTHDSAKESVFLLEDLVGKSIKSPLDHGDVGQLSRQQANDVIQDIGETVAETFRAGLGMANHFQVTQAKTTLSKTCRNGLIQIFSPCSQTSRNAFEVFGVDILLSLPSDSNQRIPVHLLEVNACPDFRQTGADRHYVIEQLFEGVLRIAVAPFFDDGASHTSISDWRAGQRRDKWLKCLDSEGR